MDSLSDSSRCELDSVTSSDSLHIFTDEFRLHHLSSPDVTNAELSKRIAALELENERLRVDVETTRIEANARNASNQGLKSKIADLFVEAQKTLQEKQRLQNSLKDATGRLAAAENSSKWYRSKLHDSQANEKARQMEIDTYQGILRQRQQNLLDMTERCKQFNAKYSELVLQFKREKRELLEQIESLRAKSESCATCAAGIAQQVNRDSSSDLMEFKLEAMEKSAEECHAQLRMLEQRLANSEISRNSAETALSKYRWLMSSMEENSQKLEAERSELNDKVCGTQVELQKLREENEQLQISVLASKREQVQVEEGIVQLRSQLNKMIAQHKLLKSRNFEAEKKLNNMQEIQNENKRLKSLSYAANSSLFKKLKEEKRRIKHLENQLRQERARFNIRDERDKTITSMRDCLRQALERNKELKDRLKTKISDESIDEGYGDGSIAGSASPDLPSPPPLDSVLIKSAVDVLSRSKNFLSPIQSSLDELRLKMEKMQHQNYEYLPNGSILSHFDISKPPLPPQSNAKSAAEEMYRLTPHYDWRAVIEPKKL